MSHKSFASSEENIVRFRELLEKLDGDAIMKEIGKDVVKYITEGNRSTTEKPIFYCSICNRIHITEAQRPPRNEEQHLDRKTFVAKLKQEGPI